MREFIQALRSVTIGGAQSSAHGVKLLQDGNKLAKRPDLSEYGQLNGRHQ